MTNYVRVRIRPCSLGMLFSMLTAIPVGVWLGSWLYDGAMSNREYTLMFGMMWATVAAWFLWTRKVPVPDRSEGDVHG